MTAFSGEWPTGLDHRFYGERVAEAAVAAAADGATGPMLDVGAGGAACALARRGLRAFVLDSSSAAVARACGAIAAGGAAVTLVRGVAERLPFRDGTFDRVLCESALDVFDDPGLAVRECARILRPDGRLVIGVVNYGGVNVETARVVYRVARRWGWAPRDRHLFWDTPVPMAHTFECTYGILRTLCGQYLELERAFGVSIGWGFPGWGDLLGRLPERRALAILRGLDRIAARVPRVADYVVSVWRQRTWQQGT